jgi:hypothetical protein
MKLSNPKIVCIYFILFFLGFSKNLFAQTYSDNASSYGGSWANNSNNSTPSGGFGQWTIAPGASSGTFVGNPADVGIGTSGIGTSSFGMYATGSAYCSANRPITNGMQVGDVLTFYWAINYDAGAGSKGFDLKNGSTTLFNVNNTGSATITTTNGTAFTSYGTTPMLVTVTRTSLNSYSFVMTARNGGTAYSTTINSSSSINVLNFYIGNQNDGAGQKNMYINGFSLAKPNQYRSKATGNWSAAGTWEISTDGGTTWANAGAAPGSGLYGTITIKSGHTVSQNQSYNAGSNNNIVVESGAILNMSGATGNFQFNSLSVSGTVVRDDIGSVYSGSNFTINNGGIYRHAVNGGSLPSVTWSSGSTFEITGTTIATSFTSGSPQSFHHVVWNCTGQSSTFSFGGLTTVNGNFTVQSTGSSPSATSCLLFTNSTAITATIAGNLTVSGGYFAPFGASTASSSSLNISGNLSIGGGSFDIYRPAANTGTINLAGDFSMSSGTLTKGGAGTANFNFAKSGTQTYSKSGGTISNAINFIVNNGSTLNMGTSVLDGSSGTFTLSSGGGLITANSGGIASSGATGSIQVTGTRTYNTGANYTFNGNSAQATGAGFAGAANLTINNSAGVTLTSSASLGGTLSLTNGALNVGTSNTITVASNGFVTATSGSLASGTGAGTFTFSGTGSVTGTIGFNNVNIAGGVNFGSASTINGILTINSGGFVNTNAPTYASGSTLKYNTTGSYGRGTEWSSTSGAGYPNNVQISNNTTLNLGNGGTNVARQCAGSLTVDNGATLSLDINAMSQALTVKGKFTNNGTTNLSSVIGGDLKLEGDMDDNGTFNANGRALFFEGGSNQSINSTTNPLDIDVIRIGKSGGEVILAQNLLVDETNDPIQFTTATSILNLNGYTATFGKANIASFITMNASSRIKSSSTSSLIILGTGAAGTIYFDQTTPGTTNALGALTINRTSSGSVVLGNAIAVTNALTITEGNVNLGTAIHTAGSLSLGGTSQTTPSSYGGTGSPAVTVNTTHFAATTGVVNVGNCSAYSITSTSAVACVGSAATVTLSNSTTSQLPVGNYTVFYTLTGANAGSSSSAMNVSAAGSGSFTTTTIANSGATTITINYIRNGCVSAISSGNTAAITINALPTALSLTGSSYCATTSAGGTVVSGTSAIGVNYSLYNNGVVMDGTEKNGTGSALTWSAVTAGSAYTAIGTNATTTCSSPASNAVAVTISDTNGAYTYYLDTDGDNYGTGTAVSGCSATTPAGYSVNTGDCNNSNNAIYPTAVELCGNSIDENCSGSTDDTPTYYRTSADGNWGTASTWEAACYSGTTYTAAAYAPSSDFNGYVNILNTHDVTIPANGTTYKAGTLDIDLGGSLTMTGNGFINSPTTGTVSPIAKLCVTVLIDNAGTLNIGHQASLVQTSTTASNTGSGNINVESKLTGTNNGTAPNGRYWYIGSPMNNTVASQFYDVDNKVRLWSYNATNNSWGVVIHSQTNTNSTLKLIPGIGYLYRAGANKTITYTGTAAANLNNNLTSNLLAPSQDATLVPVTGYNSSTGYKFVANPYPSHIDWKLVTRTGLNVSYWIRNAANNAYEAFNATSNVSTSPSGQTTQYIAPMQGFWVYAFNSTPSLRIDNTDRVHADNVLHSPVINQVVRLKLNDGKSSDYAVVYENELASNDFEETDTDKMFDYDFHQLYTMEGEHELALNGLLNATSKGSVDMGMVVPNNGPYTIEATDLEMEEDVILEDKFNHTFQDLKVNPIYSFTSNAGTFNNRFVLHFTLTPAAETAMETVEVGETVGESEGVNVYTTTGQQVKVWVTNTTDFQNATVKVYDAIGNMVERKNMTSNELLLDLNTATGVYLVEVTGDSKVFTKKIFISK